MGKKSISSLKLYTLTVRTLVKQPDAHHRAHGRECCVCGIEGSRGLRNFVKVCENIKQNMPGHS